MNRKQIVKLCVCAVLLGWVVAFALYFSGVPSGPAGWWGALVTGVVFVAEGRFHE